MCKTFVLTSLIFACFFPKTRFSQLCGFSRFAISANNKHCCNLLDLCDFTWQSWKFPVLGVVFLHFRFWDHISGFARFARFANNIYILLVSETQNWGVVSLKSILVQLQLHFCSTHINPWKQGIVLGLP